MYDLHKCEFEKVEPVMTPAERLDKWTRSGVRPKSRSVSIDHPDGYGSGSEWHVTVPRNPRKSRFDEIKHNILPLYAECP